MIRASRAALPHMVQQKSGSIINIASESARQPNEGFLDYSAFKTAMLSVAKALANEFGPLGIRVNVVSPGPIRTSLWDKPDGYTDKLAQYFDLEKEQAVEHYAKEVRKLPLGRIGTTQEVAAVVVFLASVAASFVTGAEYAVNGGSLRTI
jgi:NAD(P)-dependent dehydrogenase (short-subunit alcohol dehydrogenase family)